MNCALFVLSAVTCCCSYTVVMSCSRYISADFAELKHTDKPYKKDLL